MICSIHQPQYLPWLGYFDKIDISDVFIFLDNVQFKKNEWQNRNRIKTAKGWEWITVPALRRFGQLINEVKIDNKKNWREDHLKTLSTNYGKAKFFDCYIDMFTDLYENSWEFLSELNINIINILLKILGIGGKKIFIASQLDTKGTKTQRLVELCKAVGADIYLSGKDGAKYMDQEVFKENGIEVIFQDYQPQTYEQLFNEFQPNMSVVDLIFNCGNESPEIIRKGRKII